MTAYVSCASSIICWATIGNFSEGPWQPKQRYFSVAIHNVPQCKQPVPLLWVTRMYSKALQSISYSDAESGTELCHARGSKKPLWMDTPPQHVLACLSLGSLAYTVHCADPGSPPAASSCCAVWPLQYSMLRLPASVSPGEGACSGWSRPCCNVGLFCSASEPGALPWLSSCSLSASELACSRHCCCCSSWG